MLYQVSRNGQIYGPYTLDDLTRYVASGNVLATDLAKSEEMAEWQPVSQILGMPAAAAAGPPAPGFAGPGYAAAPYAASDAPPNLNWGLVLLFAFLTCTLFMYVWNILLAAWANRVVPGSKVLALYIAAAVLTMLQIFSGARMNVMLGMGAGHNAYRMPHYSAMYAFIALACWVTRLIARFTMRSTLLRHFNTVDPVGLRLSGVMTFFFGGLYFQYHLNRINDIKRAMGYQTGY